MSKLIRVLAALDGAPGSETALTSLIPLSQRIPIEFTLLQVVNRSEEIDDARAYLERLAGKLNINPDIRVDQGKAAEAIQLRLRTGQFDFGSLTTHARRGLSRLLTGSVTEDVLSGAEVPLFIQRPDGKVGDWEEIVVALDGSTTAEEVLDAVVRIASLTGARLHLVGVAEMPVTTLPVELTYGAVAMPDMGPYLERVMTRLSDQGLRLKAQPLRGMAAASIVRYATDIGAGLIALTTLGKTGLRRVIMGSVAQRVLRTAPCPVLVQRTRVEAVPEMTPERLARRSIRSRMRGIRPMPGWAQSP